MTIEVKMAFRHDLPAPQQETEGAAGFDLRSAAHYLLFPGDFVLVRTGFIWKIPQGWYGQIRDRSGQAYRKRLTTRAGVIDPDFRGEVKVLLVNESEDRVTVGVGDRIAQMVICRYLQDHTLIVDELDETIRGENGFGSTDP